MTIKCKCGKEISAKLLAKHIRNKCNFAKSLNEYNKLKLSLYLEYGDSEDLIKNIISDYANEQESILGIQQKYKIKKRYIIENILKFNGIDVRGMNQMATSNRLEKIKNTSIEKYGVDNASKSEEIKEKKRQSFISKYGVDNVRKSEWYKEHQRKIMLERYGVLSLPNRFGNIDLYWSKLDKDTKRTLTEPMWRAAQRKWKSLTDNEKSAIINKRKTTFAINQQAGLHNNNWFGSSLEVRIKNILDNRGIKNRQQFFIDRRSFDFKIDDKIILEIHGDYWHASPLIYKEDDLISYPGNKKIIAKEIWQKDIEKRDICLKYNYEYNVLWENEIRALSDNCLGDKICEMINAYQNKINQKSQI